MNAAHVRSCFFIPLLLSLLLTACNGGKAPIPIPPGPPQIDPVLPAGVSVCSGLSLRFVAHGGSPSSTYAWDFGDGALPRTSTEAEPLVTFGEPGDYVGSVIVCEMECAEPIAFDYQVLPLPSRFLDPFGIARVAPTGTVGPTGKSISFFATVEGDIMSVQWDFGTGALPRFSNDPSPLVTLGAPGAYQGTLTINGAVGHQENLNFAFVVATAPFVTPPRIDAILGDLQSSCDNKPIAFQAIVPSDVPLTYRWTLESGGVPVSTAESTLQIQTAHTSGTYAGSLVVENEYGTSDPVTFAFTILDCPDAQVRRVFPPDRPLGPVYFETTYAQQPQHEIVGFDSPGILIKQTEYRAQMVALPTNGTLTGFIEGWREKDGLPGDRALISEVVTHPSPMPLWQRVAEIPSADSQAAITLIDGTPVLTYVSTGGNLRCATPSTPNPETAEWNHHIVAPSGASSSSGRFHRVDLCDGTLIITLPAPFSVPLRIAVAQVAMPQSTADWNVLEVPELGTGVDFATGALSNGQLLIVAGKKGTDHPTVAICQPHPQSAADFTISHPFDSQVPAFAFRGAAIGWQDRYVLLLHNWNQTRTFMASARTQTPTSDSDWNYDVLDPLALGVFKPTSVHLFAGPDRLWLGARVLSLGGFLSEGELSGRYAWTASVPTSAGDWTFTDRCDDVQVPVSPYALTQVDGRPLLAFSGEEGPWLHRALTPTPSQSSDWYKLLMVDGSGDPLTLEFDSIVSDGQKVWAAGTVFRDDVSQLELYTATMAW